MPLTTEDLRKISEILAVELNGKLDKKFEPMYLELAKMNAQLEKLDDKIDANSLLLIRLL